MHITRVLTTLLVGGLVLGLAVPAQAQLAQQGTYSGAVQWSSSGKTYDLEKGHVFFTGEFTGTFVNSAGEGFLHNAAVVCPGVNDVSLHTKKGRARGYCLVTDSAGNRAYLAWQCEGDTVRCLGT